MPMVPEAYTESEILKNIQNALLGFSLRAEKVADETLGETFVDTAPLFDLLMNPNNQIIYGRRGTGKTHALKVIAGKIKDTDNYPVYVDLRTVGSNTSIYNDPNKSLSERAITLIRDVLQSVLSSLYVIAIERVSNALHPNQITIRLDDFQSAIFSTKIEGELERSSESGRASSSGLSSELTISADPDYKIAINTSEEKSKKASVKERGKEIPHINIGNTHTSLTGLIDVLGIKKLWLLLDEWSELPLDLQPYLADLIRRTILPAGNCLVKIAAIEHRSQFSLRANPNAREYIGFELGADVTANLNLDEFLVCETNEEKSINFFKNLLFRHYKSNSNSLDVIDTADKFMRAAFTQGNVFKEFVRAVEGVPRDALNLATILATKSYGHRMSMQHVTESARTWYQQDKSAVLRGNENLSAVLMIIINEVIGTRRARAFLFPSNVRYPVIDTLFDSRLLHILKKNISSKDDPGTRYDVYKIDYGCYVELLNTNKEPLGLFPTESGYVERVPDDDYRSIRRAILTPELLHAH